MSTWCNMRSTALITTFGIHKCVITLKSNLSATSRSRPENGGRQLISNGTSNHEPTEKASFKTVGKSVAFSEGCWGTLHLYREAFRSLGWGLMRWISGNGSLPPSLMTWVRFLEPTQKSQVCASHVWSQHSCGAMRGRDKRTLNSSFSALISWVCAFTSAHCKN